MRKEDDENLNSIQIFESQYGLNEIALYDSSHVKSVPRVNLKVAFADDDNYIYFASFDSSVYSIRR
jgi:hypothetical protein